MNRERKPYMLTNQNSTAFWLIDNLWMTLATSHHTQDNFHSWSRFAVPGLVDRKPTCTPPTKAW